MESDQFVSVPLLTHRRDGVCLERENKWPEVGRNEMMKESTDYCKERIQQLHNYF